MATVKKAMKKPMMKKSAPMQASPMGSGSMMKKGGKVKKYQNSGAPLKASPDSTNYFNKQANTAARQMATAKTPVEQSLASNRLAAANKGLARQKAKKAMPKQKMGGKTSKMSKKK